MNEDPFKQINNGLDSQNNCNDSVLADVVVEKTSGDPCGI